MPARAPEPDNSGATRRRRRVVKQEAGPADAVSAAAVDPESPAPWAAADQDPATVKRVQDITRYMDSGAENTDLIIADGQTVWLRTLPIGGNNFTEALASARQAGSS